MHGPLPAFSLRLNGMIHRDNHTASSVVYMTSVYNTVSNVCLKKCIHGFMWFLIIFFAGAEIDNLIT
jgi:hypothetical protein